MSDATAAATATTERRAPIHLWIAGLLVVAALLRFAALELSMPFLSNDWIWLRRVESFERFARESRGSEAVRFASLFIFAVSRRLFGEDPRPIAAAYLAIHLGGVALGVQLLRRLGFRRRTAIVAGLAAFFTSATFACFESLTSNEAALGRAALIALLLPLLAPRPRAQVWIPILVLAFVSHEIVTVAPALLVVCLAYRDGIKSALRFLRSATGIAFLALYSALLALRLHHAAQVGHATHRLGLDQLGANLAFFLQGVRFEWLERAGGGVILLAIGARWVLRKRGISYTPPPLPRALAFAAAWAIVGYAPFFLATSYRNDYFLTTAHLGPALAAALLLDPALVLIDDLARRSHASRFAAVIASAVVAQAVIGGSVLRVDPGWMRRGAAVIRGGIESAADQTTGLTPVIFVESARYHAKLPPALYLGLAGCDEDRPIMTTVIRPAKPFRFVRLEERHLPYLCASRGDAIFGVDGDGDETDVLQVTLKSPCADRADSDGVPPGLAISADDPEATAFLDEAKLYWKARRHGDVDDALTRLARLREAAHRGVRSLKPEVVQTILEAASAARPCRSPDDASCTAPFDR